MPGAACDELADGTLLSFEAGLLVGRFDGLDSSTSTSTPAGPARGAAAWSDSAVKGW